MILSNKEKKDLDDAIRAAEPAFNKIEAGDTNLTTSEAANIMHARERMTHYLTKETNAEAL